MSRDETVQLLAILKAAYPNSYSKLTIPEANGIIGIWHEQFRRIPGSVVLIAVKKLISKNTFPPSIAEVMEKIKSLHFEATEILLVGSDLKPEIKQRLKEIKDVGYLLISTSEPSLYSLIDSGREEKKIETSD